MNKADSVEIVVSVTPSQTIGFRIFPHYKNGYINVDKARDSAALARQLLRFCDTNFLFWGADNTNDVFAGYTVTLQSGYPEEPVHVVLTIITALDKFVGEMRPFIEFKALDKILAEQKFSNSDRAGPTSAAKIGNLLGVDAIVVGSITQFGRDDKSTTVGGGGAGIVGRHFGFGGAGVNKKEAKAVVQITARLVMVNTGEIVASAPGM